MDPEGAAAANPSSVETCEKNCCWVSGRWAELLIVQGGIGEHGRIAGRENGIYNKVQTFPG